MAERTMNVKRALCLLLTLVMLLGALPLCASAASPGTIKVAGGISKSGGSQVYSAPAGTDVTLTAGKSTTGRVFWKWEVLSPAGLTLADEKSSVTTFTMPGENVEVRAIFKTADTVMTSGELVAKAVDVAKNYRTLYVMGCFGAPLNAANKARYINSYSYNAEPERAAMINAATDDTFGFDCVCFIKGLLWGWNGDAGRIYGGAAYMSNGVPDINTEALINVCSNVTTTFDHSTMVPGEAVWMSGHVGIYIGNGLAVECSPKWENKVQITACNTDVSGYNRRNWSKHGLLPYVDYGANSAADLDQTNIAVAGNHEYRVDVPSTALYADSTVSYSGAKHFNSENGPGYVRAVVYSADGSEDPKQAYKVTLDCVLNDLSVGDRVWSGDQGVIMAMLGSGKTMGYNSSTGKFFISSAGGGWMGNPRDYVAQTDGRLSEGSFYRFEYIVEPSRLTLRVNGEVAVSADISEAFAPGQYFIFYPKHADMDILMAEVSYLDGKTVSTMSGYGVFDSPHWRIDTPAAYAPVNGTYSVSFRGCEPSRAKAVTQAINAIGTVRCREYVQDAPFTGVSYNGYGCDPADGYTHFTGNAGEPFYVSFDFSISRFDPSRPGAGFGGQFRTENGAVFAGYDFESGRFVIRSDSLSSSEPRDPVIYSSKARKLETGRIYRMRTEFTDGGIRLYADGQLVCSTNLVSWHSGNWYSFIPGGCDADIADFEYGAISGTVYYGMEQMRGKGFFSPDRHYTDGASFRADAVFDSNEAILKAERMYAALSAGEKAAVTNYATLTSARARYDQLLASAVVRGDADGDGKVGPGDVETLRKYLAGYDYDTGESTFTPASGADMNGDGEIDIKDVMLLEQYAANSAYGG